MAKRKLPPEVAKFFKREGKRGGLMSAAARLEKMTPEERSEVARKAAAASAEVRSRKAAARKTESGA